MRPPPTPRTMTYLGVNKLKNWKIWLMRCWGRCLKVTLQTHAPENFRSCWSSVRRRWARTPIGVSGIINCRGWIMLFYHCTPFTLFRQLCDHMSLLNWMHFTLCICWIMQLYHCTLFSYHWLNWVIQFLYTLQRGWIIELCHCKDPVDNWCHFIIKNMLIKFPCIIS